MLNKTEGEELPGIGRGKPAPIEKWARVLGMLDVAATAAEIEFAKLGAPQPIKFTEANILVQEYHLLAKVIFLFWMKINGVDRYYPYTFALGENILGELAVTGKWPAIHAMPADVRMH